METRQQYLTKEQRTFLEEILENKHVKTPLSSKDKEILKTIISDFSDPATEGTTNEQQKASTGGQNERKR